MDLNSVKGCADFLGVAPSTVRRWIRTGQLTAEIRNGSYWLPEEQNYRFFINKFREFEARPRRPYVPRAIADYDRWHTVLDEFCWLVKVTYTPVPELRRKQFRLDVAFANYLRGSVGEMDRIAGALGPKPTRDATVAGDLRRGWYNELAFAMPLRESLIGLTFQDIRRNQDISNSRFVFPSWRIVSAYYAIYFFLRSVTIQKEPNVNLQRHSATINAFKHNVMPSLASSIWKFPYDIAWTPGARMLKRETVVARLPHLRHKYARHPREPNRSPVESLDFIRGFFRQRSKARKNPTTYNLIDLLRELRVWANYIDIDNLINLWGPGYRTFLDQNLSTLLFFLAGVGELGFLAVREERIYLAQLQSFYDHFVCNNPEVEKAFGRSPMFHRMLIYRELGLIGGEIKLRVTTDINEISI